MATISSPGLGSNLDVKSIVSQLVTLEKAPLQQLQVKAATVQTQVSAYGQIKSLMSDLSDAASRLTSVTGWNGVTTTSSNTGAVSATAVGGTASANYSVEVQGLAKAQAYASASLIPVGGGLGAGTIRLELGRWTLEPASFLPQSGTPIDIPIGSATTVSEVASLINEQKAGISATVLNDGTGERLMLRSTATGEDAGFQLSVIDDDGVNDDDQGLSRLVAGSAITQYGENARATINGVAVTSASNTLSGSIPGVTFNLSQVTTSPVEVSITRDTTTVKKNLEDFVKAYNAVNQMLVESTKYDQATQTAGILQGDRTAINIQNTLRNLLQSSTGGTTVKQLSDIGITQQLGGALTIDSAKLSTSLEKLDGVRDFFRTDNSNPVTNGMALKLRDFAKGLLAAGGAIDNRDDALQASLKRNADEQLKVNERASRIETQLNKRYSALDTKMSSLNALSAYVQQQVTTWNNAGNS